MTTKNSVFFIISFVLAISYSCQDTITKVEQWDFYETTLQGPETGNPFKDVQLSATFSMGNEQIEVTGFYDGQGIYKIRFMPMKTGKWTYTTHCNVPELDNQSGRFTCVEATGNNHGPVKVRNTYHFEYADGTPYYQVGTTCYAWANQGDSLEKVTLGTLKDAPFNKIRMCIFPKDYVYNENEPVYYPFERDSLGFHDFSRFDPKFWQHLEKRILQLQELGIEADIILFHPYDRWGYATMPDDQDNFYMKYALARLSAFRHVWWSMANEFDFMKNKSMDDWHRFFQIVHGNDPYNHLRSIHNGYVMYDHSLPWVSHASIQSTHFDSARVWRERFKKPLVYDEARYEGNVTQGWGNLTPEEMTAMFWRSLITGTYAGHGETYEHPRDILWWAKGGVLHGKSPERIAFFKQYLKDAPEEGFAPFTNHSAGKYGEQYLYYFDEETPTSWQFDLPGKRKYKVELIDTWNMISQTLEERQEPNFTLELPGKPYMAVKITAEKFLFPVGKVDCMAGGLNYDENTHQVYFHGETEVHLVHTMADEIRFTLNGGPINKESKKYEKPLVISENMVLHALAFDNGREGKQMAYQFIELDLDPAKKIDHLKTGLKYAYYEGEWTSMPDFNAMSPLREGTVDYVHLKMEHREDYFGLVFDGYIKVPRDGVYTFHVVSDDGAFILVDGQKIVDNDGQHGMREARGQIGLKAGIHEFTVPYFDNWYDHGLEVYYYHEQTGRKPISNDMLFHE